MKIRIYETNDLDLDTVAGMLDQADKQANFHPEARWILCSIDGEINEHNEDGELHTKRYIELGVKWIGRESVIMWLVSNQILFEITSHKYLAEEIEALSNIDQEEDKEPEKVVLN
jgi:hypothetical protein